MKLFDITVSQGLIAVIYDDSRVEIDRNTNKYIIYLYDYNFKQVSYIDTGNIRHQLCFNFIIREHRKSLIEREKQGSKIRIGLAWSGYNKSKYTTYYGIDVNELLAVKEANRDKTIIFNNKVIVRYETNVVIKTLLLKYVLNGLSLELQQEIKDIIHKTSHTALEV